MRKTAQKLLMDVLPPEQEPLLWFSPYPSAGVVWNREVLVNLEKLSSLPEIPVTGELSGTAAVGLPAKQQKSARIVTPKNRIAFFTPQK